MPRLKPSAREIMDREFLAALDAGEQRRGMKYDEAARYLGMSKSTYYKRHKEPGKTKLCELREIVKFAKCTDDEILLMIRGEKP